MQDLLLTLRSFSTGLSASVLLQHTCSLCRSLCVGLVSLSKLLSPQRFCFHHSSGAAGLWRRVVTVVLCSGCDTVCDVTESSRPASLRLASCGEAISALAASIFTPTASLLLLLAPHFTLPVLRPLSSPRAPRPCDYLFSADVERLRAGCVYSSGAAIICHGPPAARRSDAVGAALWYSPTVAAQVWLVGWQPLSLQLGHTHTHTADIH